MSNKTILDYLEQLDLSDIEAKLYLTLLETGPISVRELAAKIDIKRTTAYLPIDQLIEKGLIMKIVKGANKLIAANAPSDSLEHLVKKKVQSAQAIEKDLPNILGSINNTLPQIKDVGEAEIKYYKGVMGVRKIYEEALQSKELRSYVNVSGIDDVFPENYKLFDNALKNNPDIKMFEIAENSPQSKKLIELSNKSDRYKFKLLPDDMTLTAQDILIYDGNVGIINLKNNVYGVILRNSDLYNNMKLLFNFTWKVIS